MSAPAVADVATPAHAPQAHRRPRLRAVPDPSRPASAPAVAFSAAEPLGPGDVLDPAAPLTVTISIDGGEGENRERILAALRELVSLAGPAADIALRAPVEVPSGEPGVISLDPAPRAAFRDGRLLDLSRLEYDLLLFFAEHPRQVFTRAQLLSRVWGHVHTGVRTVDVHISRLRTKLDDPELITTVYGVGYRLADSAPVRVV
ncbi:winged helix-turn-helix domain-containing protein [Actinoplanes sp. NPDC049265]|uniref:winged helix-turn-helix domain-containing protein n=1 Tax=Actinoplanes sp. NPDC049265 TaxID=3363902 RepID=UPI0037116A49